MTDERVDTVAGAISAFRALSQRPSPSKMEEQIGWIRKSAAELKRALGGNEFRDAFHLLRSGTVLREIHERLACLDAALDMDEIALAAEVKHGKKSEAPQWRTSRRGHLAIAAIDAYRESFPDDKGISKRMREFTAAIFKVAGEPLTDSAVREVLRSPLLKNKKPA